uniref:RNA-dependent RNA polymerase n=1 Tax=Grapevine-associated virga-like virus 2 TaxID=2814374 RepID=A0A8F7KGV8_9VIRU|nr:MAG: RNA-dependent RNA polymerase [Grapevine-associated virga-like virus 2]
MPRVGSESTPSVDSRGVDHDVPVVGMLPGENAVAELEFMNEVFRRAVLSTCVSYGDLVTVVASDAVARSTWSALSKARPSEPAVLEHRDGKLYDVLAKEQATYGGVCWNSTLMSASKFLAESAEGEVCVSSDDLRVFVVDGIDACIRRYKSVSHSCDVVLKDAPAANGKTYAITHDITVSDFAVCETSAALSELKDVLVARDPAFADRCFTVDSVLVNDRVVDSVDVLYVDEALRLHAGKIYLLMRMLKPRIVVCYGDSRQIEAISFQEGYDYSYDRFPFTTVSVESTSRTMLPCFAMALSTDKYYNRRIRTYSKVEGLPSQSVLISLS